MSQDFAQTLRAGGIVPRGAALVAGEVVDRVVARGYRHPALPGRTVVRLAAGNTVAASDIEMATLGFGDGEDRGEVGQERRRALGFPGWALVHDPDNARHALEVVKEFKRYARMARTKPGNARDGIDAIAATLGRTVPQFLPAFYEEAGRAFLEHGATSFAAAMFGKARAAEAVHALPVDEQRRIDGFLEFALAGAVTTRALTDYARELAGHHAPAAAYGHFRQLCVQRTLGGMPPWSGMAKDLRRLARAAKLDPDAEDARLIAEIIEAPALAMAASEFWRAYEAPIVALGKRSAAVRRTLIALFPSASDSAGLDEVWLDLLDRTGAIDDLAGDAADAARPSGGTAAWFDKLTEHLGRRWGATEIGERGSALLRRIAPRLIAEGTAIRCSSRWRAIDPDLAELALELGVAVEPPPRATIDLGPWAQRARDRRRDPVRLAAHPRLGPLLGEAVAAAIGSEPFDAVALGNAGLLAAKRAWLEALLVRAESRALPDVADVLATIAAKVKPATFAELPELHRRLAAIDLAQALARTLQIGLLDELGWPALEDAAHELGPDGKAALALHGGLPAVVLTSPTRAIAVGPRGRLAAHDLVIPARHALVTARYIGGQFLIVLREAERVRGYWSSAPRDLFDGEISMWHVSQIAARAVVLADGAWQEGARPIRAGDRVIPVAGLASHDGATAWLAAFVEQRDRMREASPSGEPGRLSWPAWLEAGATAEWQVDGKRSYVLPAPDGMTQSPLGMADGRLGARVAYQGEPQQPSAQAVVAIDGRRWTGRAAHAVDALVELPGGEPRPLVAQVGRQSAAMLLLDAAGAMCGARFGAGDRRYWRGSVAAYPDALWHALTARDVAGSHRLRAVSVGDARRLIDGLDGVAELAEAVPVELVARELPEITHPLLRRGVAGVVALAAELQRWRDRLRDERAPGRASARAAVTGPDDVAIKQTVAGWLEAPPWYNRIEGIPRALIEQASRELAAPIAASEALAMLCSAADVRALTADVTTAILPDGELVIDAAPEPQPGGGVPAVFTADVLRTACAYLPFLYAELPVGDPVRAHAPAAHALVVARLASQKLRIALPGHHVHGDHRATVDRVVAALGGEAITGLAAGITAHRVPGATILLASSGSAGLASWLQLRLLLHPATLDAAAAKALAPLAALIPERAVWNALQFARSADLAAMMARIADTPVPAGGWEQDPAASAPAVVERAASQLGLSGDAAALYLQYLALLWPTPKNVLRWNGWQARRLAAAHAELAGRDLIREARRERAQRSYFLPGAWDALRAPHPPMESWKLPLYGMRSGGAALPILERFAPLAPFHLLFERAWQRIAAGDVPKYDEVTP